MKIEVATKNHLSDIKNIVDTTITEIYSLYYPKGAVNFFISHHSIENILLDIDDNNIYILKIDNRIIGTITIKDNHITRLFVLPKYQGQNYGSTLMDFAEKVVFENYNIVLLDTSLSAKSFYLKRNYREIEYNKILTSNGDYLCYDVMSKNKRYSCPCCKYKTFTEPIKECWGNICPVCYWEIDFLTKDDNSPSSANHGLTLHQARNNFKKFGTCEKSFIDNVRKPFDYEI